MSEAGPGADHLAIIAFEPDGKGVGLSIWPCWPHVLTTYLLARLRRKECLSGAVCICRTQTVHARPRLLPGRCYAPWMNPSDVQRDADADVFSGPVETLLPVLHWAHTLDELYDRYELLMTVRDQTGAAAPHSRIWPPRFRTHAGAMAFRLHDLCMLQIWFRDDREAQRFLSCLVDRFAQNSLACATFAACGHKYLRAIATRHVVWEQEAIKALLPAMYGHCHYLFPDSLRVLGSSRLACEFAVDVDAAYSDALFHVPPGASRGCLQLDLRARPDADG